METAIPQWEYKEHGGWKAMSPQVNGILRNFQGEAVAIPVEHCVNVRRVYDDIGTKRQHRQYYDEEESNTWVNTCYDSSEGHSAVADRCSALCLYFFQFLCCAAIFLIA